MARLNSTRHASLTDSVISQLFHTGIYTDFDLIQKPVEILKKITGLSVKAITEIKKEFSKSYGGYKIIDASKLLKDESFISTGIFSLDNLLGGGLSSKQLYEFCGASSSGKTQLCLTIVTCIPLKTKKIVHYIDTKGDFSILRVQQILDAHKCSDEEIGRVMKNIKVTKVKSANELISILHYLTKNLEREPDTRLLVIDSLSTIFLLSSESNETIYSLNHLRNMFRFILNEFNVSIITTNLVTQWNEESGIFLKESGNPTVLKPTLGKFWFHVPNTRLLIEHAKNEERKISVWKSHDLKSGMGCDVNITCAGVN